MVLLARPVMAQVLFRKGCMWVWAAHGLEITQHVPLCACCLGYCHEAGLSAVIRMRTVLRGLVGLQPRQTDWQELYLHRGACSDECRRA